MDAVAARGKKRMRKMTAVNHCHLDAFAGDACPVGLVGIAAQRHVVRRGQVPVGLLRCQRIGGEVVARHLDGHALDQVLECSSGGLDQPEARGVFG